MAEPGAADALNTVAVVPFDVDPSTSTSRGASASFSRSTSATASSLAAAASNLISAIAQGSVDTGTAALIHEDAPSDADSDPGSSSFTYTAPASDSTETGQRGWYASAPYHISNRYYDADITLKATKDAISPPNRSAEPNAGDALSQPYPAYLVVVDRSRSLEHHRLLAAQLQTKIASGFDADISIVAGVSLISSSHPQVVTALDDVSSSSHRPKAPQASAAAKTSDLVALYADHGWEFIATDELDANDSDGAPSLGGGEDDDRYSDGDRDDDMDGIERIREALMNHMWSGLVRKDQAGPLSDRNTLRHGDTDLLASSGPFSSFSDVVVGPSDDLDPGRDGADDNRVSDNDMESDSLRQLRDRLGNASNSNDGFPTLSLDRHAEASDLDEQLARLFLSAHNGDGAGQLAELEAFLESEDPSWPGMSFKAAKGPEMADSTQTFDDDFDDFLPFQSATPSAARTELQHTTTSADDLPSMDDISRMQTRLFGANAAARLEAGPLGMGSQPSGASDGDLASQLLQLQWHAQRVRGIQDADQRRKEAALVALAFSMQWSDADDDQAGSNAGAMNF